VILATKGDLDNDKKDDFAVVLELTQTEESESIPIGTFAPRHLYVLLANADGSFAIVGKSENSIREFYTGGSFGDPLNEVAIQNGLLCLSHYGGSSDRWGDDKHYALDNGQLVLVYKKEYSHSTHSLTGEETIYDYINGTEKRFEVDLNDNNKRKLLSSKGISKTRNVLGTE
jgi:hypothetical protein